MNEKEGKVQVLDATESPVATDKSADRPLVEAVAQQIQPLVPADAKTAEPGAETASGTFAAGDGPAAAAYTEAAAFPTDMEGSKQKKKRKQRSGSPSPAPQAVPADETGTAAVRKHKKKKKNKEVPLSSETGDAAATLGNGDLPDPEARELEVMSNTWQIYNLVCLRAGVGIIRRVSIISAALACAPTTTL